MIPQEPQDAAERNSKEQEELANAAMAIELQEVLEMMGTMDTAGDHDDQNRKLIEDLGPQRVRTIRLGFPGHLKVMGFDEPNLRRWLRGEDLPLTDVVPTLAQLRRDVTPELEWLKTPYYMITIVTLVLGLASLYLLFPALQCPQGHEQWKGLCAFLLAIGALFWIGINLRNRQSLDSLTPEEDESIEQSKFATRFWFEFTRDMVYAMDVQLAISSMAGISIGNSLFFFLMMLTSLSIKGTAKIIPGLMFVCLAIAEFIICLKIHHSGAKMKLTPRWIIPPRGWKPPSKSYNDVFVSAVYLLYVKRLFGPNGGVEKAEGDFIVEKLANFFETLFGSWTINEKLLKMVKYQFLRSLRIEQAFGFDPLPDDIFQQQQANPAEA